MTAREFAQLLLSLPNQDVEFVLLASSGAGGVGVEVLALSLMLTAEGKYVATPDCGGGLYQAEPKGKC